MALSETAKKAIIAYGGIGIWKNHKYIEAEVSTKGLAFLLKRRTYLDHAKILMEIDRPFSKIFPIGRDKNIVGVLDGNDTRLETIDGEIIAERKNARHFFPDGRRLFWWDDLDMAYFANYAFWNYFTLPNLLTNHDIDWDEKAEGILRARFPCNFPTHSTIQEFYFDRDSGLLCQHNYTAEVISKYAKAANVITRHTITTDNVYPSSRRITPRNAAGKALKGPILIEIVVHQFRLLNNFKAISRF